MPLYIKDDVTAELVRKLAALRGLSKQDAVKLAVQAELDRAIAAVPLRDRFAALRLAHPLPPSTGKAADKAFLTICRAACDDLCRCLGDDRDRCRGGRCGRFG